MNVTATLQGRAAAKDEFVLHGLLCHISTLEDYLKGQLWWVLEQGPGL